MNKNNPPRFYSVICLWVMLIGAFCLLHRDALASDALRYNADMESLYLEREGAPLWFDDLRLNQRGEALLGTLRDSWRHGLNPRSYHLDMIDRGLKKKGLFGGYNDSEALYLELLLTDAFIHLARDLSGMRVPVAAMEMDASHWRKRLSASQVIGLVRDNDMSTEAVLTHVVPNTRTYRLLQQELERVTREIAGQKSVPAPITIAEKVLRPHYGDNAVPALRARFALPDVAEHERYTYDAALVEAVKAFQAENGLKPDGYLGQKTLAMLNKTPMDKLKTLIVNLERLRWFPNETRDRFIIVNIPAAHLWAIENGDIAFDMPVIVGREKRPTLSFKTYINGIRFNPTWTVPPTIMEEDILPELRKDAGYLIDKGMDLYESYAQDAPKLDPLTIDWASVTENEWKAMRLVQVPGSHNPLGRIRVLMPNRHNIYLHDTNHRGLFSRADRALSSGCVRMKYPEKVASFALHGRRGWNASQMQTVLEEAALSDVYTPHKTPVYLLYYTAWQGEGDVVFYADDIYGYDDMVWYSLENLDKKLNLGESIVYYASRRY